MVLARTGTPMTLIVASWCRAVISIVACAAFHTAPVIGKASAGQSCSAGERDAKGCGILCHCPMTGTPLVGGVQGANTHTHRLGASPLLAHLVGTLAYLSASLRVGGVPLFALSRMVVAVACSLRAVLVCVRSPERRTGWGWLNYPLEGLLQCGAVARRRYT